MFSNFLKTKEEILICRLIRKKQQNLLINSGEWKIFVQQLISSQIPDYQLSAFLMAIYFKGLKQEELFDFTKSILSQTKKITFSKDEKKIIDKHSTGGLGDKISLILLPVLKMLNFKVGKLSGKSLGMTGGTIDKLKSIPGFITEKSEKEFLKQISNFGIGICSQQNFSLVDQKLYSVRDATQTVASLPLIAISIMVKKLIFNSDLIFIDLKCGSSSFCKDLKTANSLAKLMLTIAKNFKRNVIITVTKMNTFLGRTIGNFLELKEVTSFFNNYQKSDYELRCLILFTVSVCCYFFTKKEKTKKISFQEIIEKVKHLLLTSKKPKKYFQKWIEWQNGNWSFFQKKLKNINKNEKIILYSQTTGYLKFNMNIIKELLLALNVLRTTQKTIIDHEAGFVFSKKEGDFCQVGEKIITIYGSEDKLKTLKKRKNLNLFTFFKKPKKITESKPQSLILKVFSTDKNINDKLISIFNEKNNF